MNATNDEFALWSEDFTERMRRMCEEAEVKRRARWHRLVRIVDEVTLALGVIALVGTFVTGCIYAALYVYHML